jgi:GT2 family glycosyltransferase
VLTAVMVPFGNEDAALTRLHRDLMPALRLIDGAELIVIDNSPDRLERLATAVAGNGLPYRYVWTPGNLMYGPGINFAVSLARHRYLVYVCANHGEAFDPTWIGDLLAPFTDDQVAMTGCLQDSGPPESYGFPADLFNRHIQGGVFAARTDALATRPYSHGDYQHWGADVHVCFRLVEAGWRLVDVPTIRSVWRAEPGAGPWKYLHCGGVGL